MPEQLQGIASKWNEVTGKGRAAVYGAITNVDNLLGKFGLDLPTVLKIGVDLLPGGKAINAVLDRRIPMLTVNEQLGQ